MSIHVQYNKKRLLKSHSSRLIDPYFNSSAYTIYKQTLTKHLAQPGRFTTTSILRT